MPNSSFARSIGTSLRSFRLSLLELERREVPARPLALPVIYVGAEAGAAPIVRAFDAETGALNFERTVYDPSFAGGVRVATADFTGDGYPDLVVAPGSGHEPLVRVLDGRTGDQVAGPLGSFLAYGPSVASGVVVTVADVTGDSVPDVITAATASGGPNVKVFDGATGGCWASFTTLDPDFSGGISLAAADFTHDGKAELVIGAGPGGSSRVRVLDLASGVPVPLAGPLGDFLAFEPGFHGGVNVGTDWKAGDVTGDGTPDLVIGPGAGRSPEVKIFNGLTGALVRSFLAFDSGTTTGVRVATAYVTDDALADVVVANGSGADQVRVFSGPSGQQIPGPVGSFLPFGTATTGGVSLAASNDPPGDYPSPYALPFSQTFNWLDSLNMGGDEDNDFVDLAQQVTRVSATEYEWEYTFTNQSSADPYYPTLAQFGVSFLTLSVPAADLVTFTQTPTGWTATADPVTGNVRWETAGSPIMTGQSLTFKFRTPHLVLIESYGAAMDNTRTEDPHSSGKAVVPAKPAGELTIYNGLEGATGGQKIADGDDITKGAVTVTNRNNTNGDFNTNGTEKTDRDQTNVAANGALGRDEVDLMKLVLARPLVRQGQGMPVNKGLVRVRVESGNGVQLWTTKTKNAGTQAPATLDVATAFAGNVNSVTWWVEATAASATIRDISLVYEYQQPGSTDWIKLDSVRATAVWVELSRSWTARTANPVPGDQTLPDLTDTDLKDRINTLNIAADGSRYGFGPFAVNQGADTSIGGRILMEYTVQPAGDLTALGVRFDVTRQIQQNTYGIFSDQRGVIDNPPDFRKKFPYNDNKDNELPNDDVSSSDEQNTPVNRHLYSWDAPMVGRDVSNTNVSFSIQRQWFQEWVRVRLDGDSFSNQGTKSNQLVEGSRASDRTSWHYVGYYRRDANGILVNDTNPLSAGVPLLQKNPIPAGNGTAVATALGGDTEGYGIQYSVANGTGTWTIQGLVNGAVVAADTAVSNGQPVGSPAGTTWTVTIPNRTTVVITQGAAAFAAGDTFWFVNFKSRAPGGKVNEIALGDYSDVKGDATDVP